MRLMNELNAGGRIYLTHTKLDGEVTLRLSIGQTNTERRNVEEAWRLITETAARLEGD
jgi:aromatic-L-amino-acid decarboxylase